MTDNPQQPAPFSIEEVAHYPAPGMAIPGAFSFSSDDRLLTYLFSAEGSLSRQLYVFDPETGQQRLLLAPSDGGVSEESVSLEEQLRRERQRQREIGVTQYAWAEHGQRVLVVLPAGLFMVDGTEAVLRPVVGGGDASILDPQFSPDGLWIAYVQHDELCVVSVEGGEPFRLTAGAKSTGKTHGLAEYIAQEEMGRRHRCV